MIDIAKLSSRYDVRPVREQDANEVYELCRGNPQYYRYREQGPTFKQILRDLHLTPPGINENDKYYVGFYDGGALFAVMDLIDGYPDREHAYIGFFMMAKACQGRQIGSGIVREVCLYLKDAGFSFVRLAIDKGNPQSSHFWAKNGFAVVKEAKQGSHTLLVAEKAL
ncbi:MAG: GNAT family N-acetyltransferase [Clostridia bacterium]|nr:GNAT family N-acetyltransferase [Clostridia bacterium]